MHKNFSLILIWLAIFSFSTLANETYLQKTLINKEKILALQDKKWIHGAEDCNKNAQAPIDIFRYDDSSYILRQNKCLSYEAPFIYLIFGTEKVLVLDTGATKDEAKFPLYQKVKSLIEDRKNTLNDKSLDILVLHSHNHGDHYAGDSQFEGKPSVTLIKPAIESFELFTSHLESNRGELTLDLGNRKLIIITTPGHQEEAITIYDPHTQWLLTGDSFYPGYLYVKNWREYKQSISKLVSFSQTHEVSLLLGAHIEKGRSAGQFYPVGTIYQPFESPLGLKVNDLLELDSKLRASSEVREIKADNFVVLPMNVIQRTISNFARWIVN